MNKTFKLEIKELGQQGTFRGMASIYGNKDLGGDVVEKGAFSKTLQMKSGEVPILWQHDPSEPIGLGKLTDMNDGLQIDGELALESPVAQKAYGLMKKGVLKGLSIGYDTVISDVKDKIRYLKELKLWEVSLVTFPMNEMASILSVKAVRYLVSDKDGDHLPYTGEDGKPDHRLMGAAWAALHEGFRGNKYEGPDKYAAIAKLRDVYRSEGLTAPDGKSAVLVELEQSIERLSALRAALAPEAAMLQKDEPGISHSALSGNCDQILQLLRG